MNKVFILLLLILTSCASLPTTANFEKILNRTIGMDVDTLVSRLGPPRSSYELSNGGKVLEYVWAETNVYSYTDAIATSTGFVYVPGVASENLSCKVIFTVNPSGKIVTYRWEGNNCRARAPKE
jgi:hypothetical protein